MITGELDSSPPFKRPWTVSGVALFSATAGIAYYRWRQQITIREMTVVFFAVLLPFLWFVGAAVWILAIAAIAAVERSPGLAAFFREFGRAFGALGEVLGGVYETGLHSAGRIVLWLVGIGIAVAVIGGVVGLLLIGWRALLG